MPETARAALEALIAELDTLILEASKSACTALDGADQAAFACLCQETAAAGHALIAEAGGVISGGAYEAVADDAQSAVDALFD